jgi:hypothetical protein
MIQSDRDHGSILLIVAISMAALLTFVAIVIDLGATRSTRRDTRSAADASASAGAVSLKDPAGAGTACADALAYAFRGVGGSQPSASAITTACSSMTGVCAGITPRVATLTVGSITISVTNPVPDNSSLMQATSLGSDVPQAVDAIKDGVPCERIGVFITRPQSNFFRGIAQTGARTFSVHSVARYSPSQHRGPIAPALASLNQTACNAIDAGTNGNIVFVANSAGPGVGFSDSNGPGCSGTSAIFSSRSSSRLVAESSGSAAGQLAWFAAANTNGYNNGASTYQLTPATFASTTQNYVGRLFARATRVTRVPVDQVYHCQNVPVSLQTLCTTADPIAAYQALASTSTTSAPLGFTTYSGACDSTSAVTMSGKVWVNCPTFTVKTNVLNISGGSTIIFNGALSVEAGGTLLVNTVGTTDAVTGLPVPFVPSGASGQTSLIVNSSSATAVSISSNSSTVSMAQTTLYSGGGFALSSSQSVRWTPPSEGASKGLLYWSESTQPFSLQGGPFIKAKGVVVHGNGQMTGGGGGTVDLTNVQVWVDTASLSGSTTIRLSADPENSISTSTAESRLIR